MEELQRRRIIRKGDIVIFDKGYYSYENYQIGISIYKVVPLIFPRKDFKHKRVLDRLSYLLIPYLTKGMPEETRRFFQRLKVQFKHKIQEWLEHKPIRSIIKDFFKLTKKSLTLDQLHHYTKRSVHRFVVLNALLAGIITSLGYNTKENIQKLRIMKSIGPY
ncbi:MAG: transposase [Euryarchaeota archaeon]|nr:transposase [Euryarchaeota archaeon]